MRVLQLLLLTLWVPLLQATAPSLTVRRESFLEHEREDAVNRPATVDSSVHTLAISSGGNLKRTATKPNEEACTQLKNAGSYFTAEIKVGSSSQKFDVVADTGSTAVIVADCRCATCGFSGATGAAASSGQAHCYQDHVQVTAQTPGVAMGFGSGKLEAMIATDDVTIGSVKATMTNQLLLMVAKDQDLQKVDFDGILGLGIPEKADPTHDKDWRNVTDKVRHKTTGAEYGSKTFLEEAQLTRFSICFQDGATQQTSNGYLRIGIPELGPNALGSVGTAHWGLDFRGVSVGNVKTAADVKFCTQAEMKGATTDEHGVAIPAMTSPCGAIPDSGTTLILGPAAHISKLYEEICDGWERCNTLFGSLSKSEIAAITEQLEARMKLKDELKDAVDKVLGIPVEEKKIAKEDMEAVAVATVKTTLVEALLANCSTWLTTDTGLDDELPELKFYLKGKDGKDQTLTFKGSQYIESGEIKDIGQIQQAAGGGSGGGIGGGSNSGGIGDGGTGGGGITGGDTGGGNFLEGRKTLAKEPYLDFLKRTGSRHETKTRVCLAAFDTVDYPTATNGPVWILGTPLFYSFKVSFESDPSKGGPSMQFEEGQCAECAASMLDGPSTPSASKGMPRRINGRPRWPSKPMSGPF